MSKKDMSTKMYMSDPARFADAFNSLLFQGKEVVKAAALKEQDVTELSVVLANGSKEEVQKIRDLLKKAILYEDGEVRYLLLGIENQTDIHYAMPVRCMVYDALNYDRQVREIASKNKKERNLKSEEYLSGFTKTDRLKPIITLTIYFGSKEWDGARNLHEMMEVKNKNILKYVNNYELNLIVPKEIEDFSSFRTELKNVMQFLALSDSQKHLKETIAKDKGYEKLSVSTVELLNELTDAGIPVKEGEKEVNMCKGMLEWAAEEREEGRAEGRKEGREEERVTMMKKMIQKHYAKEQILDLGYSEEEYEKAEQELLAKA